MEHAADCGVILPAPLAYYDPDTQSLRTCAGSLALMLEPDSQESLPTWPGSGTMRNGRLYPLPPLAHHTAESESLLWPTAATRDHHAQGMGMNTAARSLGLAREAALWPTPNTMDHLGQRSPEAQEYQLRRGNPEGSRRNTTGNLREDVMWATPRASPNENRTTKLTPSQQEGRRGEYLAVQAITASSSPSPAAHSGTTGSSSAPRGSLATGFVEGLMGFPPGWTEIPE